KADDTLLTNIVSLDPVYAAFDVDERTLLRLRRMVQSGEIRSARENKMPILLALIDEEGFYDSKGQPRHEGFIQFIDNKVDPQTGTLHARAESPTPPVVGATGPTRRLLSAGLFVRMRFPVGGPHPATLVAEQAFGTDQGQKFVWVVNAAN